jgi:hypothetical protein
MWESNLVEDHRHDIREVHGFRDPSTFLLPGQPHDQRNSNLCLIDTITMPKIIVFAKTFPMIGDDYH